MGLERLQLKRGTGAIETIKENPAGIKKAGYFDYWSWKTFIPITVKATGGILTALVHKQSGSVMKGFSLVLGLVISALLQTILDGEDLTMSQIFGTALILLSSWLHFTSPP
jgi:UDP-sugar transporter A1/2/3